MPVFSRHYKDDDDESEEKVVRTQANLLTTVMVDVLALEDFVDLENITFAMCWQARNKEGKIRMGLYAAQDNEPICEGCTVSLISTIMAMSMAGDEYQPPFMLEEGTGE